MRHPRPATTWSLHNILYNNTRMPNAQRLGVCCRYNIAVPLPAAAIQHAAEVYVYTYFSPYTYYISVCMFILNRLQQQCIRCLYIPKEAEWTLSFARLWHTGALITFTFIPSSLSLSTYAYINYLIFPPSPLLLLLLPFSFVCVRVCVCRSTSIQN